MERAKDFLRRFGSEERRLDSGGLAGGGGGADSEVIELSLGLSLGGCFGADRETKKPRLARSSSVASICSLSSNGGGGASGDDLAAVAAAAAPLVRTSSLPTETEEERWRRREMQSLKRMEAKRKRLERRNSLNSVKSGAAVKERGGAERTEDSTEMIQLKKAINGFAGLPAMLSQGSGGSQGSSSSSVPEQVLDKGGVCDCTEVRSPSTVKPSPDSANHHKALPRTASAGMAMNGTNMGENQLRSLTIRTSSTGDLRGFMMEDMPMVSSKVEGPNGRRIEGFLYKYKKGEEVRIVCVCHGSFLTPAEFVKHAGGGDVTNPLRHIVVNPSPSAFL